MVAGGRDTLVGGWAEPPSRKLRDGAGVAVVCGGELADWQRVAQAVGVDALLDAGAAYTNISPRVS